ncbi:hypothetical protein BDV37DRAFT_244084 [Aspergillus pseudonomiae]|uniref:Uncharacterized protein n=1 Tax=Aspergillus pseudonomiae TaxID=1506151 RepID=A0A5N7DI31_9EURO|nr:uncharacterized protein BDV37DRAFT_244084 [Aspergillus pseudonomiae]KAE8406116.1 hypothetical protein BDV37DRAFT_244084 [Aspergillus pseudonomiae]
MYSSISLQHLTQYPTVPTRHNNLLPNQHIPEPENRAEPDPNLKPDVSAHTPRPPPKQVQVEPYRRKTEKKRVRHTAQTPYI